MTISIQSVPPLTATAGQQIVVPVILNNPGVPPGVPPNNISNYDFAVLFNSSVLTATGIDTTGTLSAGTLASGTPTAGRLGVSDIAFPTAITGSGTLVKLIFTVNAGAAVGATTTLDIDTSGANTYGFGDADSGNTLSPTATDGAFIVAATTAASVTISGRVLTSSGAGLRNARVTLTDAAGRVHSVLTSAFGRYSFDGVPSGASYVVGVQAKSYNFQSRLVTVTDSLANVDFAP